MRYALRQRGGTTYAEIDATPVADAIDDAQWPVRFVGPRADGAWNQIAAERVTAEGRDAVILTFIDPEGKRPDRVLSLPPGGGPPQSRPAGSRAAWECNQSVAQPDGTIFVYRDTIGDELAHGDPAPEIYILAPIA